jgi:multidrug efflux pump subunit AcrB
MSAARMPTDIFPEIRIPIIGVAWQYSGLSPTEMAGRIITGYERGLLTNVNDIDHIESQSLPGIGVVKVFFQPGVDVRTVTGQVNNSAQFSLRSMPAGTQPPLIVTYSPATVPILQLAYSSPTMTEQELSDQVQTVLRPALSSVPGYASPTAYGGRTRQLQIDLDPQALMARGLSSQDVQQALGEQVQILPTGAVKIGELQYYVKLNSAAETPEQMNNLPIRSGPDGIVYLRDVGHVRDGSPPQNNIVHVDGRRAVLSSVLKNGTASTVAIVDGVKARLPGLQERLPPDMVVTPLNDQSVFVKGAVMGVVQEAVLAAIVTSLMILLFLGSPRSTAIIAISIPLSLLAAIAGLAALGETLNLMTLGGLALAVGILVDDATVTVENINWHLEQGKDVRTAILDGARQIVTPAFVSLLCICIVFVPMWNLTGIARFLFVPMAEAVALAMIASFILSRTLVPTLAMAWLKPPRPHGEPAPEPVGRWAGVRRAASGIHRRFDDGFGRLRVRYREALVAAMAGRRTFLLGFATVVGASLLLTPTLGQDFFPSIDTGQIAIHVRARSGLRIEQTSALCGDIEAQIRRTIPPGEIASIVDNIGVPNSALNLVYSNSGVIGPQDADIYVTLKPGPRRTAEYVKRLRAELPTAFPGVTFAFLPADMVSQILNFGAPAPIDLQIAGPNTKANRAYAGILLRKLRAIPGLADVRLQQTEGAPQLGVEVDRVRAGRIGVTERDVTSSVLTFLAGSGQVAPNYWLNPKNNVSYPIVAQAPDYRIRSLSDLEGLPITGSSAAAGAQMLGALGTVKRGSEPATISHSDSQLVLDIYATPEGRDLGALSREIRKVIQDTKAQTPKGTTVALRGQPMTMDAALTGLSFGLLAAIVLIYLVLVVNFQSWTDPLVIIGGLPAALAGIVWILFATGTTLSVPALTGAIMCMGVATANSILVVSFARERLAETGDALGSAIEAGFVRFRPVVMTALAMIVGITPMALGLGEAGEQNAPLGRAVIGGLACATIATLMVVPLLFALAHRRAPHAAPEPEGALRPAE